MHTSISPNLGWLPVSKSHDTQNQNMTSAVNPLLKLTLAQSRDGSAMVCMMDMMMDSLKFFGDES